MNSLAKTRDDGFAAYRQRNYTKAIEIWKSLAAQNDAEAQFNLGIMYKDGIGVPPDQTEAINWLHKSSSLGHVNAGLILSMMQLDSDDEDANKA